jgi:hypothetical protein
MRIQLSIIWITLSSVIPSLLRREEGLITQFKIPSMLGSLNLNTIWIGLKVSAALDNMIQALSNI